MFQTLQPNQKLYILHETGTPYLETGIVQNIAPPKNDPMTTYGQMPTQSVDVTLLVNGQTLTYTLPANAVIGTLRGSGGITVSMSKEAMSNKIAGLKQISIDIINSVEYHQGVIAKCEEMWNALNPEAIENRRRENELNDLKSQVATMTTNVNQLMEMNRRLMEKLDAKETPSKKNKE